MRKMILGAVLVVGVALVVGAQGPPRDFDGPMGGMMAFGGLMGGFGGKVVTGKPILATITITHTETLPDNNAISNTSTGTFARSTDGSTYRDVKFAAIGPWATGEGREFTYIRNLAQGMQYVVNVAKATYRAFPIGEHHPSGGAKRSSDSATETVTDNPNGTYTDPATNTAYPVDDQKVTRTIPAGAIGNQLPIVITSERWYSSALDLLLQDTHSDPRFGTTTYQLSNIGQLPATFQFTPDPSLTAEQGKSHRNAPAPPQN